MNIAYLGMGAMGVRMSANLLKAGHQVRVWNRLGSVNGDKNKALLVQQGAVACDTIEEAVAGCEIIGMCVTDDKAVRAVVETALPALAEGAIVIDHSTISPETTIELYEFLKKNGKYFLDGPISGGEKGAEEGTLTIMVGGDREAFDKTEIYLAAVSNNAVYMGASGRGSITKLVNQHLAGVGQAIVCEAFTMAKKAEIEIEALYKVIMQSWGRSFVFERSVLERLKDSTFYPTYAPSEMMNKDLHHVVELAESLEAPCVFAKTASGFFQANVDAGRGKWDHSSIVLSMLEAAEKEHE